MPTYIGATPVGSTSLNGDCLPLLHLFPFRFRLGTRKKFLMTKSYLRLQPSEGFVIQAASQIFSAQIIAGKLTDTNRDELLKQAIRDAIRISIAVDDAIISDGETA
jgi:hypothetical protein